MLWVGDRICYITGSVVSAYLLCDGAGVLDQLSLGETVRRAHLQGSGLLDQIDAAVTQLLHPSLDLRSHLETAMISSLRKSELASKSE